MNKNLIGIIVLVIIVIGFAIVMPGTYINKRFVQEPNNDMIQVDYKDDSKWLKNIDPDSTSEIDITSIICTGVYYCYADPKTTAKPLGTKQKPGMSKIMVSRFISEYSGSNSYSVWLKKKHKNYFIKSNQLPRDDNQSLELKIIWTDWKD